MGIDDLDHGYQLPRQFEAECPYRRGADQGRPKFRFIETFTK